MSAFEAFIVFAPRNSEKGMSNSSVTYAGQVIT